jgi:hypothetical protein
VCGGGGGLIEICCDTSRGLDVESLTHGLPHVNDSMSGTVCQGIRFQQQDHLTLILLAAKWGMISP